MRKLKQDKAITLVALVITIIVLLILAGVTITLVLGENGILNRVKIATEETRGASVEEQVVLWKADIEISKHAGGTVETYEQIRDRLHNEKLLTDEDIFELAKPENINLEVTIGSRTISFKIGSIGENEPNFTTVANAPDTNGFNKESTYYVAWNLEGNEYKINEGTKINGTAPSNWYDYTTGVNHWANVKTIGGGNDCYWVWIPRYAYKVPTKGSTAQIIDIAFLKNTGSTTNDIIDTNKKAEIEVEGGFKTTPTPGTWVIHPAFTNEGNGGLGELAGIWVAKYEASSSGVETITIENGTLTADTNSLIGNGGGTNTSLQVRVKPNVTSWRGISVSGIFTVCQNITKSGNSLQETIGLDAHMMKNTEWGAVAYLSSSKYGKIDSNGNRVRVYNNPYYNNTTNYSPITGLAGISATQINNGTTTNVYVYNTTKGIEASTTGNVYGVYDMVGGAWEYVSAVWKGETSNVDTSELWKESNARYVDQYTETMGSQSMYYGNTAKYGDAVYETSSSGYSNIGSWDATNSYFLCSNGPVFVRGGHASSGSGAGVFAFFSHTGGATVDICFRPVVVSIQQ